MTLQRATSPPSRAAARRRRRLRSPPGFGLVSTPSRQDADLPGCFAGRSSARGAREWSRRSRCQPAAAAASDGRCSASRAATWRLVMKRPNGAFLSAVGSDIRERVRCPTPGDPRCFPSAWKTRIWRWNGTRFVASPWKTTPGARPYASARSQERLLQDAVRNIVCGYGYGGKDPAYVVVRDQERTQACHRPRRGAEVLPTSNRVFSARDGPHATGGIRSARASQRAMPASSS